MIKLPVLTHLRVTEYGLFPGKPSGEGITWEFRPGLSLFVGINGLGKTTLLMMILRSLTGPFDLTGRGVPEALAVTLPEAPVKLRKPGIQYFAQRVSDGAVSARVSLSATIDGSDIRIERRLNDLSLESLYLDNDAVELANKRQKREPQFQSILTQLMGVGNFVDVLLVLHHIILFHENRPGALWNSNAQRHLLRALCLESQDATLVADLERRVQSADSRARNIHARITATEKDLDEETSRVAGARGVVAELEAVQSILDADLVKIDRLEADLQRLETDRQNARLAVARSRLEREESMAAVEKVKYLRLFQLFPEMEDATRLIMSRIMADGHCLVCNSDATEKRLQLEAEISKGHCPICGAKPEFPKTVTPPFEFERAKLDKAVQRLELAKQDVDNRSNQLSESTSEFNQAVEELSQLRRTTDEKKLENSKLRAELPQPENIENFQQTLVTLERQHAESKAECATQLRELRDLLNSRKTTITERSKELIDTFSELANALLVEDVRLVQDSVRPAYLQSPGLLGNDLEVPAFKAEMTAANHAGYVRRNTPDDVSESQRELIDLAFRLALATVMASTNSCTFVMETPEASLDGLAMRRVGRALGHFAANNQNRLVVTSNLTNTGIVAALFGGRTSNPRDVQERLRNVLNLMDVAAPNQALLREKDHYEALLDESVSGVIG